MKRSEPRPPGEGLAYKYVLSSSAAAVAESGRKKTEFYLRRHNIWCFGGEICGVDNQIIHT